MKILFKTFWYNFKNCTTCIPFAQCTMAHLPAKTKPPLALSMKRSRQLIKSWADLGCLLSGVKQVSSLYCSQTEFFSPWWKPVTIIVTGKCAALGQLKEVMENWAESWSSESNNDFPISLLEQSWNEATLGQDFSMILASDSWHWHQTSQLEYDYLLGCVK